MEPQKEFDAKRFLVIASTLGYFSFILILIFKGLPSNNKEIVIGLVMAVSTAWGVIVGYYFGSSSGSARKTDAIINGGQPPNNGETK